MLTITSINSILSAKVSQFMIDLSEGSHNRCPGVAFSSASSSGLPTNGRPRQTPGSSNALALHFSHHVHGSHSEDTSLREHSLDVWMKASFTSGNPQPEWSTAIQSLSGLSRLATKFLQEQHYEPQIVSCCRVHFRDVDWLRVADCRFCPGATK